MKTRSSVRNGTPKARTKGKPVELLAGGNPRIAKAEGDAPVQAYVAALPGWKRDVGRRLDALVVRAVPGVRKAVKWNSPLYGVEGKGWFLSLHAFTHYVRVAFFRGAALRPLPPGTSTNEDTRYFDVREGEALDEAQLAKWVKQAAALPGWVPQPPQPRAKLSKEGTMKHSTTKQDGASASQRIDQRIAELGDWRGETLRRLRALIKEADPDIVEEWKWMGTPVFSHDGIVCTGETYKSVVKMTFAKGASLKDPSRLFNSSLDGNVRRAIDIREGDEIDVRALKALIRAAVALNVAGKKKTKKVPAKRAVR
jgi:hypothetical protein